MNLQLWLSLIIVLIGAFCLIRFVVKINPNLTGGYKGNDANIIKHWYMNFFLFGLIIGVGMGVLFIEHNDLKKTIVALSCFELAFGVLTVPVFHSILSSYRKGE